MPDTSAPGMVQFLPFIFIFFIFYLLLIRPEKNKQRQRKEMIANLKKNDQIVTAGGIHGTIVNVKDTTLILRVDDNVKLEIDKEAFSSLITK